MVPREMATLAFLLAGGLLAAGAPVGPPAPPEDRKAPATAQAEEEARSAMAEADRLFSGGEAAGHGRQALEVLERALRAAPDRYELLWRAARAGYHVAESADRNEALALLSQAIEAGERAVGSSPERVEGHFWLGASYGSYAERKGGFKAWRLTGKLREEMEAVLRLQPDYEGGDAYRALGELDRQLPWILGGRKSRGLTRLQEGSRRCPANLELRLSLATAYMDTGRREEARRELQAILNTPVDPARPGAGRDARKEAQRRLDSLGAPDDQSRRPAAAGPHRDAA